MSNAIAKRNETAVATRAVRTPTFMVPDSYEAIEVMARKLCAARWVPKSYFDKNGQPNTAMVEVAIMHGLDVGLPPLAAVQNIAVINGMPTVWGDAMMALVQASGLLEDATETYDGNGDDMKCVCVYRRVGRASPIQSSFSVAMAKRAGLWNKPGPWTQYPARMLKLRARSWGLRDGFSDVLKGMRMAEEVLDGGPLMDDGTGVYVPSSSAPPRPQRVDYATVTISAGDADDIPAADATELPEEEPAFSLVTATGETLTWEDAGDAEAVLDEFSRALQAGGMKVWVANQDLRDRLIDAGFRLPDPPSLV